MKAAAAMLVIFSCAASAQIPNFTYEPIDYPGGASQEAVDRSGNLWIADPGNGALVRIDPRSGSYTAYPVPSDEHALLYNLTTTPDGSVWFADSQNPIVGRLSVRGEFFRYVVPKAPYFIAGGADGGVYFNYLSLPNALGHLTADGAQYRQFNLPAGAVVENLIVGPDGAAYFTDLRTNHRVVRVALDGSVQSFADSVANPPASFTWFPSIATGPDGNIWFSHATAIGRLRLPGGTITEYPIPYANADASGITAGGDGNVWFADSLAGAGVVSQLVISSATDDGHATINASPGIGEPIGILLVPPGPATASSASVIRRAGTADPCADQKFIVEQNKTSRNLALATVATSNPHCADLDVELLSFRVAEDGETARLNIGIFNDGPDDAAAPRLIVDEMGASGFFVTSFPSWNCSLAQGSSSIVICDRTSVLAAGESDVAEFALVAGSGSGSKSSLLQAFAEVFSSTPDPNPGDNFLTNADAYLDLQERAYIHGLLFPPPPAAPPVIRNPH